MRNIKGSWHWVQDRHEYWVPGRYVLVGWRKVTQSYTTYIPWVKWVPTKVLRWGGLIISIPGHPEFYLKKVIVSRTYTKPIWKYIPGHKAYYYTPRLVRDKPIGEVPPNSHLNTPKLVRTIVGAGLLSFGILSVYVAGSAYLAGGSGVSITGSVLADTGIGTFESTLYSAMFLHDPEPWWLSNE